MTSNNELQGRIEELEADLRYRDDQIKDLRRENSRAFDLVDKMRGHAEDGNALLDSWKEAFSMELKDDGWHFQPDKVAEAYGVLFEENEKMVRDFNRLVGKYNRIAVPRGLGRPLQASGAQIKEVRKLRKAGTSLRAIAEQTGLGLRTVRTIIGRDAGADRTVKHTNLLRKREIDRLRAAEYRVRKRTRDQLPKRIAEIQKRGEALVKAAKGLGG